VEERRRDIIAATVPLLEEEGFAVSTKKIADAAGVAEGTLFRVFPTKEELLRAAITSYMDPSDLIARLDAVDRDLPLARKMSEVMSILQESAFRARTFMMTMRGVSVEAMARARVGAGSTEWIERRVRPGATFMHSFGPHRGLDAVGSPSDCDGHQHHQHPFVAQARALSEAIERLLANNQSQLAVDLPTAAAYIFTTGIASLLVTTGPGDPLKVMDPLGTVLPDRPGLSAPGVGTYVALTLRALTIDGASGGEGTSGDGSATVPSPSPTPHRKEQQ